MNRKFAKAFFKGTFIYCLLVWLYIIVEVKIRPQIIEYHWNLATLVPMREDFLAVISFAISGISFIIWEYLRS